MDIDFILRQPAIEAGVESLPQEIQAKIEACQNFKSNPLIMKTINACGRDYLHALKEQETGPCCHRSLVFKDWMRMHYPEIPARIVENGCHSFVELFYKEQWIACNLGGYPAVVKISEWDLDSTKAQEKAVIAHLGSTGQMRAAEGEKQYFPPAAASQGRPEHPKRYMQQLLDLPQQNILIQVNATASLSGLRYLLQQYCHSIHRPCFYVDSPEALVCSSPYIQREGDIGRPRKGPGGPLHQFLTQHLHDKSKALLLINYDNFSASEIVQFNALSGSRLLAARILFAHGQQWLRSGSGKGLDFNPCGARDSQGCPDLEQQFAPLIFWSL